VFDSEVLKAADEFMAKRNAAWPNERAINSVYQAELIDPVF
jgi:hypothetical protein